MIKENSYFEGNVKSLGYTSESGNATVGVMEAGEYEFNTGTPEIMTVIQGEMEVLLAGEDQWQIYGAGTSYHVPGNSSFKVKMSQQTSYLCQF